MKKKIINGAVLFAVAALFILPFAACDTGNSSEPDATETPETPETPDTPDAPVLVGKVDFESANIAALSSDGFTAETGDVRATWGDASTGGAAVSDMAFSADSATVSSGAASLKVTATVLQNQYSTNVAQFSFKVDLAKAGVSAPVDLTGKTVSVKANIPASSALTAVKLVLRDSNGKQSQGKENPVAVKDEWTAVSYAFGNPSDYTEDGFDVAKVAAVSIIAIKNDAASASSETIYLDNLDW